MLGVFHTNLWFDESYSVAIAKHSITDIWNITGNDVHPALYYWMLHLLFLIFGNNIIVYRIFSAIAVAILGILGYTHIRKDFGDKVRNTIFISNLFFTCYEHIFPRNKNVFLVMPIYNFNCNICL